MSTLAFRLLEEAHGTRRGSAHEALIRRGTAQDEEPAELHVLLAGCCFGLHTRGAQAAAELLQRRAASLLSHASASSFSTDMPHNRAHLIEPELAVRLLLALTHSAEPEQAALGLAEVLKRHGLNARGRAAPGSAGAMRVHELPFGLRIRAIPLVGRMLGANLECMPIASCVLKNEPTHRKANAGNSRRERDTASLLSRLRLDMAAGALAPISGGCNVSKWCKGHGTASQTTAFCTRAVTLERLPPAAHGKSRRPQRDNAQTTLSIAQPLSIVPQPPRVVTHERGRRWVRPPDPPLSLVHSPPPRGLQPPPMPPVMGLQDTLAYNKSPLDEALAASRSVQKRRRRRSSTASNHDDDAGGVTGEGDMRPSSEVHPRSRRPQGLAAEDGSIAASAHSLLLHLQGLTTNRRAGVAPLKGVDVPLGAPPCSLHVAVDSAAARARALWELAERLRRGGWGAIGMALGAAVQARLTTCSRCLGEVPSLVRSRVFGAGAWVDRRTSKSAADHGATGTTGGWTLTELCTLVYSRGAINEQARLASIVLAAFMHAEEGPPRLNESSAAEAAPGAPCVGQSSEALTTEERLQSMPPSGDGLLLLQGLHVHLSSAGLLAASEERALCLALFRATARPWLQALGMGVFTADKRVFAAGRPFAEATGGGSASCQFSLLPSSFQQQVASLARECASCVLLLQTSAAARRYTGLMLELSGAPSGALHATTAYIDRAATAAASAFRLPTATKLALAGTRAEWARRHARAEGELRILADMYDAYDAAAGAAASAAAAERSAAIELDRALEEAWSLRAAAAARESQRKVRVALAEQLEYKAARAAEAAAADAAAMEEAEEIVRLAAAEVEVRKAALIARFEEQMRGAERRARLARWRAARSRSTPTRKVALRRALSSVFEENETSRTLMFSDKPEQGTSDVPAIQQQDETGDIVTAGEEGDSQPQESSMLCDTREDNESAVTEAVFCEEGSGGKVAAAGLTSPEMKHAHQEARLDTERVMSIKAFSPTASTDLVAPSEIARDMENAEGTAQVHEELMVAIDEEAIAAEAAAEMDAIERAKREAEEAEAAEAAAARELEAAKAAIDEGMSRVARANADLSAARRALAAIDALPLAEILASSGVAVRESLEAASGSAENSTRIYGDDATGGMQCSQGHFASALALEHATHDPRQLSLRPIGSDEFDGPRAAMVDMAHPTSVGTSAKCPVLAQEALSDTLDGNSANIPRPIELPVSVLLHDCVLSPLLATRSILGRAAVLYLKRECRLVPWLAALRRFLLGGDGNLMDGIAVELQNAFASGAVEAELAAQRGEAEAARCGRGAVAAAASKNQRSFVLQRALELAISRAEIAVSAGEIDCTSALRLDWSSRPQPVAVCAAAAETGQREAASRATETASAIVGAAGDVDAVHRIDAFDGISLVLQLPATLEDFLDTSQYQGVFQFALRLKRATLAHRSLYNQLNRASLGLPIPLDARHRLSLHTHSLGQLLRSFEQHALGSDDSWSVLCTAIEGAKFPAIIAEAHSDFVATVASRCAISNRGVSAVVGAILGLVVTLERDVMARLRAGGPPPGVGAGTLAAWEVVWRKMIDASRRQLALLCNALASSGSSFAPLVGAAFPATQ